MGNTSRPEYVDFRPLLEDLRALLGSDESIALRIALEYQDANPRLVPSSDAIWNLRNGRTAQPSKHLGDAIEWLHEHITMVD